MFKTVLQIEGMACSMCEAHINDAVRKDFAVKKVNSSYTKGQTTIVSNDELDIDALKATIDKTGYNMLSAEQTPYEKNTPLHNPFKAIRKPWSK